MKFEDFMGISKFSVFSWCFHMVNSLYSGGSKGFHQFPAIDNDIME